MIPWIAAARPATLPAAVVPVVVGTAVAGHAGTVRVLTFVAALAAAVLIQVGTNYANDVFDYRSSADTEQRLGPRRLIQSGLASPAQVMAAAFLTFGLAALIGLYLVWIGGWPILAIGTLCILAGVAYTGGPWPFGYRGLGDVVCFVFFGLVAVVGTAYLHLGTTTRLAWIAAIPVGLLVTNILVVNNLRDIDTDRAVGKNTLAVRLGPGATRLQYVLSLIGAFLVPLLLVLTGEVGWLFWLPWLTWPLALRLARDIVSLEGPALNRVLKRSGQLHLAFGLLFAASLWL
ncbi:MAG: 1,4-dihydroxy-2-naphthoate polyprenyltransferase [Chloroflexi bacterium]|nr:1,4-dihydroxy-2-naphthoate polyprenyltransferase [Chloroflexota bacterium]